MQRKWLKFVLYISFKNIILNKFNKIDIYIKKKMLYDRICVEFYNR